MNVTDLTDELLRRQRKKDRPEEMIIDLVDEITGPEVRIRSSQGPARVGMAGRGLQDLLQRLHQHIQWLKVNESDDSVPTELPPDWCWVIRRINGKVYIDLQCSSLHWGEK